MEVSTALLLRTPLFRGIPQEALPALLEGLGARKRRCGRGEVVLRRGERADRLGLVLSGTLHIVKEDFWGSRTIVGLARSGEVFAEAYACLGGEPLEVAVLAAADAEVLFLNSVQALSCARPGAAEFTRNLLTILAGRNLTLTRKIGHMARRTTRDKLPPTAGRLSGGGPQRHVYRAWKAPGRGCADVSKKPFPPASADGAD